MKVINVGRFPPPIGGVSYFLKRLKPYLDDADIENVFYDISGMDIERKKENGVICCSQIRCFIKILFQKKSLVVLHASRLPILLAATLLAFKHEIAIFTHGESILKRKDQGFIYKILLKNIDYFVTPTELIYSELSQQYPFYKNKIFYIPFILFPKYIEPIILPEVKKARSNSEFLLAGYAYDLSIYNGEDLYGVDMMIDLVYRLRKDSISVSMVLLLPNCTNDNYYNELVKRIEEYELEDYFIIVSEKLNEATSLYKIADIYIRPTNTDGDSFSVWEALYVKTQVVASDAAQRPQGCIVFENRDFDDLYFKTKYIIENYSERTEELEKITVNGNEEALINFFRK